MAMGGGFERNAGGIDGWDYEMTGMGDGQVGILRDMISLVGMDSLRPQALMRLAHLDPFDAQVVASAFEDSIAHLAAPCNKGLLHQIARAYADDDEFAVQALLPATMVYAITRIDASMAGGALDYVLGMFIKRPVDIPYLERPGAYANDDESDDDEDGDEIEDEDDVDTDEDEFYSMRQEAR